MSKNRNNKGYDCTKHNYKLEQIGICNQLADQGVRELILVAQETTLYGVDLYGKKMLPELLHKLAEIPGIYWIRVQYCYPEEITDELIQVMKEEPKICHYLDLPIQHVVVYINVTLCTIAEA